MKKSLLVTLGLGLLSGYVPAALAQAQNASMPSTNTLNLAPVDLRGLGTISGSFSPSDAGASQLTIQARDAAKAQLVQAKFLSDLALLPGVSSVTIPVGGQQIEAHAVQGQGVMAAVREGAKVRVFTATDTEKLGAQLRAAQLAPGAVSRAEVQVPMWLDRWDKFGFRFYYRPWDKPKGETAESYDVIKEFDFAQSQARAGFVFWNHVLFNDNAAGMTNEGWWHWAYEEARKRKLPVAVNSTAGNPTWLLNKYRDQTQLKMPGFIGNYGRIMSTNRGGQGSLSWNGPEIQDAVLGIVQQALRKYAADENVTSFLEPHGELIHGKHDILLEYGPASDANYRRYLRGKYPTVATVANRWGKPLKSWDEVRVPELASFAGWGPEALDLAGEWSVGYEELLGKEFTPENYPERVIQASKPAPAEWFSANFDDSTWPKIRVSDHAQQLFTPKRPAVFRRTFEVPAAWRAANDRVWLYVWDMGRVGRDKVRYVVNGKEVGTDTTTDNFPHWAAVEVTSALQDGKNTVAVRLPQGYIGYRTYLSPVPPRQYPALGDHLNAQWVDFLDFNQWSRLEICKRGMEMLRQVDPNRQITLMHPDEYSDGIKQLAINYGGNFHNTGWMAVFWGDYLNSVMRGAGLPFSLEPGSPAADLPELKKFLGRYQTEGIQGIDYFIHVGPIMWNEDQRKYFEAYRPQLEMLGKYHYAQAETAVLYSDRIAQLTGYPWNLDSNTNLGAGYWSWNAASVLRGHFPYDGLTQGSFANGDANKYRVIIDSNTSVMDETMTREIEAWVRNGGTFITLAQTGRHTPEKPDSWPISRLTGYKVTKIDQLKPNGDIGEKGTLQSAPGQTVLGQTWDGVTANGLHLEKTADDTQDLLLWNDGTIAAGMRPLGKGFIVQLGAKFTGEKIRDRVDPGDNSAETRQLQEMLHSLLQWRNVSKENGRLRQENNFVIMRPSISNNGLYDVWTVWNQSADKSQNVSLEFTQGQRPAFVIDARNRKQTPLNAAKLDLVLEPLETRVLLTPRQQLSQAPLQWLNLQRNWWRGTTAPDPKPFPKPDQRYVLELNEGWKYQPVQTNAQPFLAAQVQDTDWKTTHIGVWNTRERGQHNVLRREFTVPDKWTNGRISLWLTSWEGTSFVGEGRVFLDGREIKKFGQGGIAGLELAALKPGTSHVLAVEIKSEGVLAGLRGHSWLAFEPAPAQKQDLAGPWAASKDALRFDAQTSLPGTYDAQMLRRTFQLDAKHRGQDIYTVVDGSGPLVGVIINGTLIRRHYNMIGERWNLNITPFVKFGEQNELQLVTWKGPGKGTVREVSLGLYDPKVFG